MSGESTGMGLYLAKQVCAKLGHTLTLSSSWARRDYGGAAFSDEGHSSVEL